MFQLNTPIRDNWYPISGHEYNELPDKPTDRVQNPFFRKGTPVIHSTLGPGQVRGPERHVWVAAKNTISGQPQWIEGGRTTTIDYKPAVIHQGVSEVDLKDIVLQDGIYPHQVIERAGGLPTGRDSLLKNYMYGQRRRRSTRKSRSRKSKKRSRSRRRKKRR